MLEVDLTFTLTIIRKYYRYRCRSQVMNVWVATGDTYTMVPGEDTVQPLVTLHHNNLVEYKCWFWSTVNTSPWTTQRFSKLREEL